MLATATSRRARLSTQTSALGELLARANLTFSGVGLLAFAIGGWFAAHWIGSRTAYLMVYAAVLAMFVGWLVARRRLAIDVDRSELPARMREGQTTDVVLKVTGRRRPSTLILEE